MKDKQEQSINDHLNGLVYKKDRRKVSYDNREHGWSLKNISTLAILRYLRYFQDGVCEDSIMRGGFPDEFGTALRGGIATDKYLVRKIVARKMNSLCKLDLVVPYSGSQWGISQLGIQTVHDNRSKYGPGYSAIEYFKRIEDIMEYLERQGPMKGSYNHFMSNVGLIEGCRTLFDLHGALDKFMTGANSASNHDRMLAAYMVGSAESFITTLKS